MFNPLRLTGTDPLSHEAQYAYLKKMLGSVGEKVWIAKTFNCDNGKNIHIGRNFTGNYNLTILDIREVWIGNNVVVAENAENAPVYGVCQCGTDSL